MWYFIVHLNAFREYTNVLAETALFHCQHSIVKNTSLSFEKTMKIVSDSSIMKEKAEMSYWHYSTAVKLLGIDRTTILPSIFVRFHGGTFSHLNRCDLNTMVAIRFALNICPCHCDLTNKSYFYFDVNGGSGCPSHFVKR